MLLHCFQRNPEGILDTQRGRKVFSPPRSDLPEARDHLAGQGVGPNRGDQADQGDSGVPEFDGLRARLFHNDIGIW